VTGSALSWLRSYLSDRSQVVKLGHHQSSAVNLNVDVHQGTVLGRLLFALYGSPVGDIIPEHTVQYHHYVDDTLLYLAMCSDNRPKGLSVLAACTSDIRLLYMQNNLQLDLHKPEALIVGTSPQLKQVIPAVPSVTVTGIDLPVAEKMKVLGVILDRRLTFEKHAMAVARSCIYHTHAIHHIRHLLTTELAQTLACSLIFVKN